MNHRKPVTSWFSDILQNRLLQSKAIASLSDVDLIPSHTRKHVIELSFFLTACFCLSPDHSSLDYLPRTTGNYDFRTVQAISKVRCITYDGGID